MVTIFVVEDEGIVALDIKRHLENYGYLVPSVFAAGEDAIQAVAETPPDLVLMDISLQGEMDGLEAASIIRESFKVPVILLTAYADERTIERAKTSAPFGYIIKPFEARELRTTIEMALHRAELERKLHESEERYRRFFQDDLSADFVCDSEGTLIDCNISYLDLFGFSSLSDALEVNLNDLFRDQEEHFRFWNAINNNKRMKLAEFAMKHSDGKSLMVRANIVPQFDNSGGLSEINGFVFDTTRLRELEDQLRQAQKMEAIGRLAGGVAHDFNNILTVIMGYATMLGEKVSSGEEVFSDIDGILKASKKATTLTRQLLAFSRRQVLNPKPVNLNLLINDMEKMMQRLVNEDVHIVLLPASDPAPVLVDPGQIEQVLMNLVVNARDAMPGGGKILIEVRREELMQPLPSAMGIISTGQYMVMTVSDSGTGISPEDLELIFEPFYTTKPDEKGTGLGLATVYGIVKQSNGYIVVETRLGQGTSFHVYLPFSSVLDAEVTVVQAAQEQPGGNEVVLVVEDEEGVLELVERILVKAGYQVLTARNGGEALLIQESSSHPIELLVTDLIMPHLNGKELSDRMRLINRHLKVLFISGYPERSIRERDIDLGNDCLLNKPFEPSDLLRQVRFLLDA